VVKHRTSAATLIEEGNVRLNRAKVVKPAHVVRPTDVLTITMSDTVRVLRVKDTGTRRGPFSEACQLYEDLTSASSQVEKDRA
jgi:ribosome-associated heat shock protein Hsp15